MARRKRARRRGPTLTVPDRLLEALERVHGPLDADRLAAAVGRLNAGLTGERAAAGADYLRDRRLRAAYGTYYLCANVAKPWPVLDALAARLPDPLDVLELGCGPGTGVASLGLWARRHDRAVRHLATDRVPANLTDARRLADALELPVETAAADLLQPLPPQVGDQPRDLVLLMNVVNELPEGADERLGTDLRALTKPGGVVLVIEPAAREPSRRALALRDQMVGAGWTPLLPCTHARACTALADADGWCHGAWEFERPAFMAAIDARVGLRRQTLKATYFALTPAPTELRGLRVVSDRFDEKGRSRLLTCGPDGLHTLELQRRDRTAANAAFFEAQRHDRVDVDGLEPVGDALRLGPTSTFTRLDGV